MTDELFEGAEINGKKFPFVRVTPASHARILNKLKPTIREIIAQSLFRSSSNKRAWKKVRSIAFIKTGTWKWCRIIPKELWCSDIPLRLAGGIQADFFAYVKAEVNAHDALLNSVMPSKTESELKKSEV